MTGFLQATIYGLLQGGLLALVAVGFSLVWGVMNVVNLSHGAFVVLGAYLGWQLNSSLGLDPFIGMIVVALILFCIGYAVQRFLINLVVNGPIFITLLLTFGLELLLVQGMNIVFTANYQSITTSYAGNAIVLGGIQVPLGQLLAFPPGVGMTWARGRRMPTANRNASSRPSGTCMPPSTIALPAYEVGMLW